jgi:hypothetical protein
VERRVALRLTDGDDVVADEGECGVREQASIRLGRVSREVGRCPEEVARPARKVAGAERREEEPTGAEPGADSPEQRREELSRDVVEDVERRDGRERAGREVDRRQVGVQVFRLRNALARACELRLGQVDTRQPGSSGERSRLVRPAAAAELDDARALGQAVEQLAAPVDTRVVLDPVLPCLPGVDHRVVARRDEEGAIVAHSTSTSTSSSRAAASACASASMEVSAVAIT